MSGQPVPSNLCRLVGGVLAPVQSHDLPPQIGDCWRAGDVTLTVTRVVPHADDRCAWTLTLSDSQEVDLFEYR